MTLKPPMTTCSRPTALASATTPVRSGPESAPGGMACLDRGDEQRDGLLGELLALLQPLRRRQRHVRSTQLLGLFAIDLGPLGLVPGSKQWPCTGSHVPNATPLSQGSAPGVAAGAPVFSRVAM